MKQHLKSHIYLSLILSIDTSVKSCSVALHNSSLLLALSELHHEKSASGMLTTLIADVLKHANHTFDDLAAIAISKGPGSYTGLRIGVSTAKGLCFTLDKPLIGINTLSAMAWQLRGIYPDAFLCPMIDARRMEIYGAVFDSDTQEMLSPTHAHIIDENSFADFLTKKRMIFFGDGAKKCMETIRHQNAVFLPDDFTPSAKNMGILAYQAYQNTQFENLETFEPFYLKEFMTKLKTEL